jgi:peptidyl-prolyl cis-trans isomerase A (cyclophilin A)
MNGMIRLAVMALITGALKAQTPGAPQAGSTPAKPARENGLYAVMNTSEGVIALRWFEKEAPITVRNFTGLVRGTKEFRDPKTGQMVKRPFFTGVAFHRVIPGFMIQGGDPTGTGGYDAGYTIVDEFVPTLKFDVTGRLAMANTGELHTGSTQFFITDGTPQHLNGHHTIFGQVVEGLDVVTKIANVPRGANDKPKTPVKIMSIKLERVGPAPAPPAATKKAGTVKKAAPAKKTP